MKTSIEQFSPVIDSFAKFVQANKRQISPSIFADEFGKIKKYYIKNNQQDLFCRESDTFAETLLQDQQNDFAGIIMSYLCKINEFIPERLECYAQKGLEIAKKNDDPIHIMARLNDLRKVYYRRYDKLRNYISVIKSQEKVLEELIVEYDMISQRHHTVSRKIAPKKDYELMLAHVRTEIGKLTKKYQPVEAKEKLIAAQATFKERGYNKNVEYINLLLSEIKNVSNKT